MDCYFFQTLQIFHFSQFLYHFIDLLGFLNTLIVESDQSFRFNLCFQFHGQIRLLQKVEIIQFSYKAYNSCDHLKIIMFLTTDEQPTNSVSKTQPTIKNANIMYHKALKKFLKINLKYEQVLKKKNISEHSQRSQTIEFSKKYLQKEDYSIKRSYSYTKDQQELHENKTKQLVRIKNINFQKSIKIRQNIVKNRLSTLSGKSNNYQSIKLSSKSHQKFVAQNKINILKSNQEKRNSIVQGQLNRKQKIENYKLQKIQSLKELRINQIKSILQRIRSKAVQIKIMQQTQTHKNTQLPTIKTKQLKQKRQILKLHAANQNKVLHDPHEMEKESQKKPIVIDYIIIK